MADILGPGSNATNVVTTRPTDTRIFAASDTFFRDCSSPGASDGTVVPAAFLNATLAQLRTAIRSGGVTEDNTDDAMLWKAMQAAALAAGGRTQVYAVATGAANVYTITPTPAFASLAAMTGVEFLVLVSTTNTGASTLNVSGRGAVAITRADGMALRASDLTAGQVVSLVYDGTAFRGVSLSPAATRSQVYAVATGAVNAYAITPTPAFASLTAMTGVAFHVLISATNTGTSWLNVNGLGDVAITRADFSSLQAGDLPGGQVVQLIYATGVFVLLGRSPARVETPRAWVLFDGTTGAIISSYGVSSVTRVSTGNYTVTLASAQPTANYPVVATVQSYSAWELDGAAMTARVKGSGKTTTSFGISTANTNYGGSTMQDFPQVQAIVFGA